MRDEPKELAQSLAKEEKRVDRWKKKKGKLGQSYSNDEAEQKVPATKKNGRLRIFFCCVHFLLFLHVFRGPNSTVRVTDSIPAKWTNDVLIGRDRSKQQ